MSRFQPDSSLVADVVPSPNCGERRNNAKPDMVLLHYTGMAEANAALQRLCSPESMVSAHYLVFEDGRIVQCVPEAERAWHAGVSFWAGVSDVNSCSIGVEIANPGHDFGYPDFPPRQIAAVIALCRGIIIRRGIRADRVLAHSDVAPARKQDPGEKFPWQLLSEAGVGLWTKPAALAEGARLALGASGDSVRALQRDLAAFGYGIETNAVYDEATEQVVTAFQRHFRQQRVDGQADFSTLQTLEALLAARLAVSSAAAPPATSGLDAPPPHPHS